MNVKELKEELKFAKDDDEVCVEFPDMGKGGYDKTDEVIVATERGRVTIVAAIL